MTCKDCIHYEACKDWDNLCDEEYGFEKNTIIKTLSSVCPQFSDKSRFIELPCKVGDKVYYADLILNREIKQFEPKIKRSKVMKITIEKNVVCNYIIYYHCENGKIFFNENIGKGVFLTREEAEKALKERESE